MEEIKHYQINGQFRVVFERSAVKGVIGYKVEANGDDITQVMKDAETLKRQAEEATQEVE
jgi:hypothetical protein